MTIDSAILQRFFAGSYSRRDYLTIKEYLDKPGKEFELRMLIQHHWMELGKQSLPSMNIDHLLDLLQHRIRLEENAAARKINFWKLFQKVAAILILPLALSFVAYLVYSPKAIAPGSAWAEIDCPLGVRTRFHLPDGTTGFLNSGSTLRYPVVFGNNRQVSVTGEAWFKVPHNPGLPFEVQTGRMSVRVLGTEFDVIAYPDDKYEEVILQSGSVQVTGKTGKEFAQLKPDERLTIDFTTGAVQKTKVSASQYLGWKEGKLVFRNEGMTQVARRLSRWYNADIVVADNRLLHYTFHATVVDEPLDEVLKLLALTTPIMVEETKRIPSVDCVYQKRKIALKLNQKKINQFK